MEILYFFQEKETPMYQWQRIHFIDELSRHGVNFTWVNPLAFATAEEANEALIQKVRANCQYDLFFTNICYHKAIYPETIDIIKEIGIPTLCFRSDNLTIPYFDIVTGTHFDLLWLTSSDTQYLYNKWGIKTIFAPYAANPYFFKYYEPNLLIRNACFIGTPYGSRPIMINALTDNGIYTDVYYKTNKQLQKENVKSILKSNPIIPNRYFQFWNDFLFKEGRMVLLGKIMNKLSGQTKLSHNDYMKAFPSVLYEEQSHVYSEHTLSLSSTSSRSTDVLSKPLNVLNLRTFEIPMGGGIQICKYCTELADYFEDGKEILFYQSNDELVDKARYYTQKASDKEILQMKYFARSRAENEHTWWNRFIKIFDMLGLKY